MFYLLLHSQNWFHLIYKIKGGKSTKFRAKSQVYFFCLKTTLLPPVFSNIFQVYFTNDILQYHVNQEYMARLKNNDFKELIF